MTSFPAQNFIHTWAKRLFTDRIFWVFLVAALFARFWNLDQSQYFIWDQGRDAWALTRIVSGDPVLVGPTSGLQGFFLGPAWFYAGVPGFILSNGNPYGVAAWYIAIASLAIPLFWIVGHTLFPRNKKWAIITALLLAFIPGSIRGSIFIWNPLLSLPLVTAGSLALLYARQSRAALFTAFFVWGVVLHSEFAYAVFFIAPLWLLIPWIRERFDWKDQLGATLAVGVTFIPQLLFELRNQFVMTRALLSGVASGKNGISWAQLFGQRPGQLFDVTSEVLLGKFENSEILMTALLLTGIVGLWQVWRGEWTIRTQQKNWQIWSVLVILPYIGYSLWRGNYGYLFSYYVTPHFILLVPIIVLGAYRVSQLTLKLGQYTLTGRILMLLGAGVWLGASYNTWYTSVLNPRNQAGLAIMEQSINRVYDWRTQDGVSPGTIRVYTPNGQTEHYDYLLHWKAKQNNTSVPSTIRNESDTTWYILMEQERNNLVGLFNPWYKTATEGGVLVRREDIGALTLETWMTPEQAAAQNMIDLTPILNSSPQRIR